VVTFQETLQTEVCMDYLHFICQLEDTTEYLAFSTSTLVTLFPSSNLHVLTIITSMI